MKKKNIGMYAALVLASAAFDTPINYEPRSKKRVTKSTLSKTEKKRRKKSKAARKARRKNRS